MIKDSRLKINAQIQDEQVRGQGANIVAVDLKVLSSTSVFAGLQKDSVEHNYYGDKEKITEEDFQLAKALDKKKLRVAYAG